MRDLIERLEALTEPSREIDDEIAAAFAWTLVDDIECLWRGPVGQVQQTPCYTGSLDAALTLLPEGCEDWTVCRDGKRGLDCWASIGAQDMAPAFTAETPAIALLIAIMKARTSSE